MSKDKTTISGEDISEMMLRVEPFLARMMSSFGPDEEVLALMAIAAWGVFNIGASQGHELAKSFALEMANRAHEIEEILAEEEAAEQDDVGEWKYDA